MFDGRRAAGVRWRQDGAREVGALPRRGRARGRLDRLGRRSCCSPASAPGEELQALGIPVVLDKPGVGENLQDHLQLRLIYKVAGVKTLNETYRSLPRPGAHGARLRAAPARAAHHGALAARPVHALRSRRASAPISSSTSSRCRSTSSAIRCTSFPAFTASVCNLQPTSRGFVRLRSADRRRQAGDQAELSLDRRGPPRRRRFDPRRAPDRGAAGARANISRSNICRDASVGDDDAALIKAAGDIGTTIFHPVGTAKMGRATDPMAVVDERLRVIGTRAPARGRCLGDADDHLRQHQRADHDDRREGRRDDPRGRAQRLAGRRAERQCGAMTR